MKTIIFVLFFIFFLGCAHKITVINPTFKVGDNIEITNKWIKDKEEKFDLGFRLSNNGNQYITLSWRDFSCGKGEVEGFIPKKKLFGFKKGVVEIPGKGSKDLILICNIRTDLPGNYFIGLNKNFSDPNAKPEFVKWHLNTK